MGGGGGDDFIGERERRRARAPPVVVFFSLQISSDRGLNSPDDWVFYAEMKRFSQIHLTRDCGFNY